MKIRDLRKKDQYKIDDAYLNGYAKLCGVYATAVYNSLSRHANFHTQECFPSIERMAEQHNIDRKTVIKAIRELEKWNIVKIIKGKDKKTKRQLPNLYILLDKSEWISMPARVDEKDPGRSPSQGESRVPEKDYNDPHQIKENKDCAAPAAPGLSFNIGEPGEPSNTGNNDSVGAKKDLLPITSEESAKKISEMASNKRPHIRILSLYFQKKGFIFSNNEMLNQAIKREARVASQLIGYPIEDIAFMMDWLERNSKDYEWKLGTVFKKIDDYRAERHRLNQSH